MVRAQLRDPDGGCPWGVEQTFATILPHTIEEAYEVADAIDNNDMAALKDELGDLLFQVVFYAQMAREEGGFDFDDIARAIGRPSAVRAIGGAVGANPIGLLIPCHRGILKSGAIHNYRWGVERKHAILAIEQAGLGK